MDRLHEDNSDQGVAHVDIGHFNPAGLQTLRATISRESTANRSTTESLSERKSIYSDITVGVENGAFDFGKVLRTISKKQVEADVETRELGVAFENLTVKGLGANTSYQPTVASLFNPRDVLEGIQNLRHPPVRDILNGFEGVVEPGEMLLVLGSPGSGCSTFLKTIANHRSEYHSIEGDVYYNSLTSEDVESHYRGDVQYCPEEDEHFPSLTVEQTIEFAVKCRTPRTQFLQGSREEYCKFYTEILLTVFGLTHVRHTPVGDASLRGVSGGQKKRVSIAESLATRAAINCWDNATRGLDSSTALEFVRALRLATDLGRVTTVVALYQAGELLYRHFDKVCVLYQGKMAYFGPANRARQYFIDLGYEPANRQTTPDFLVAVTDPLARIPRAGFTTQPRSAEEFARYFLSSELGNANRKAINDYKATYVGRTDLAKAYKSSARAERANFHRKSSPYTISIPMQIRAVMLRRAQIIRGNWIVPVLNFSVLLMQAILVGTLFLNVPETTSAFFSRGGILFFSVLLNALVAMAEIPSLFAQRRIILRHQIAALYHPFVEALALTIVDLPILFLAIAGFCCGMYFLTQLQQTVEQFFIYFLFVFFVAVTMKSWFRSIAAACQDEANATTLAGVSILGFVMYTGYTIPKSLMIGALRWITYINPMRFAFEALITNEFRTIRGRCSTLIPQGPGYENVALENQVCTTPGSLPGQELVDGSLFVKLAFGFSYSNTWKNFGILCAFVIGSTLILLVLTELNTQAAHQKSITFFKRNSKANSGRKRGPDSMGQVTISSEKTSTGRMSDNPGRFSDVFSWCHLDYTIPVSGEADRKLLNDVSGYVAPGKLTALMGESGAGKTTLLNALAERVSTGIVQGDRFVNGCPLPKDFQAQTGYCQQMDVHEGTSTVREALLFSAKLRQPSNVPLSEKEAYVEECLELCGLQEYADAAIGSLNIEHKKRTTIGVELAAKPRLLLFLDEPTSGLDSQSAWAIVTFLRNLADRGQAILCTIHQPSAELFQAFDRLLLLKKGGETVYFGDLGHHSSTLLDYFARHTRSCGPEENPAEYMLDMIGAGATATSELDWHQIWRSSPEYRSLQSTLDTLHSQGRLQGAVQETQQSDFATSWGHQLVQLSRRQFAAYYRDPIYIMSKFGLSIVSGLFIGFTFFHSKDTQQGTQNKLFSIFITTLLASPFSNQLQVPFINMRTIYEIRERPSRMYSWSALVASQVLVEIPWGILVSSVYFFTWYWTIGYDSTAERAGYVYLMLGILFPVHYSTFGQTVAALSPSAEIAALLFSAVFSFTVVFSGVLQPFRELNWWKWVYRVNPYTYLIEGVLGATVGKTTIQCSPIEMVTLNPPLGQTCGEYLNAFISFAGGYLLNPDARESCSFCSTKDSDTFLQQTYNIEYDHRWRNVGIMFAFIIFNVVLTFVFTYLFRIRTWNLSRFRRS